MKQIASCLPILCLLLWSLGCEPEAAPKVLPEAAQGQKEVLHQRWQAEAWQDYARTLIRHDSTGLPAENVELRLQEDGWGMASRESFRHSGGNLVETLREVWTDGGWRKEGRQTLDYDPQGRLLESFREAWAWYDEAWFEAGREEHSYADEGRLHTALVQRPTYDDEGYQAQLGARPRLEPAWHNSELVTQRLGAGGEVLEEVTQRWRDEAWLNSGKKEHDYDDVGRQVETRFYVWQDTTWAPALRMTYHDHDDGTREAVVQRSTGDGWVNATRTLEREAGER